MSASGNQTRRVQLHCPEFDATVNDFMIMPSMSYCDLTTGVQAAFPPYKPDYIDLRDINGDQLFDAKGNAFPFYELQTVSAFRSGLTQLSACSLSWSTRWRCS
jgi:hypothetical protein